MISPYRLIFHISSLAILFMVMYLLLHLIPFQWFVDIDYVDYEDICVGEQVQTVLTDRRTTWPTQAHVYSQVVKIEGVKIIETTISRESNYGYEESGFQEFLVKWDEPFDEEGRYGVNSWIEIYPLPFITIREFESYTNDQFNVMSCD